MTRYSRNGRLKIARNAAASQEPSASPLAIMMTMPQGIRDAIDGVWTAGDDRLSAAGLDAQLMRKSVPGHRPQAQGVSRRESREAEPLQPSRHAVAPMKTAMVEAREAPMCDQWVAIATVLAEPNNAASAKTKNPIDCQ